MYLDCWLHGRIHNSDSQPHRSLRSTFCFFHKTFPKSVRKTADSCTYQIKTKYTPYPICHIIIDYTKWAGEREQGVYAKHILSGPVSVYHSNFLSTWRSTGSKLDSCGQYHFMELCSPVHTEWRTESRTTPDLTTIKQATNHTRILLNDVWIECCVNGYENTTPERILVLGRSTSNYFSCWNLEHIWVGHFPDSVPTHVRSKNQPEIAKNALGNDINHHSI